MNLKSKHKAKSFINGVTGAVFSLVMASVVLNPLLALADFNPNKLIDDKVFTDTATFGSAAGIQQFLQSKQSILANTDTNFLLMLREPQDSAVKTGLEDPQPNLGRLRTAAELIWDSSVKTGLNPQAILVTLQKEQSLITATFDSSRVQRALDFALGFGCPDTSGCEPIFKGFYFQLFGNFDSQGNRYIGAPGSLMRSFNTVGGRGPGVDALNQTYGTPIVRTSKINDTISINNTTGGPQNPAPQQTITISNAATAALYRYTPHVYNGNYNFWKFFQAWFKYPNGTLIKLASDGQSYIINNGLKSLIPNFVIISRGLNPSTAIVVSPTEFSDYDNGPMYGPADNVVVKVVNDPANKNYVFQNSVRHPVSDFVLKQRGLSAANALVITQADADLFLPGTLLPPSDGTLIQGDKSKTVFVVANGKKMILSGFTFKQYGYAYKNIKVLPQDEVDGYPSGGFYLPKDGTLVSVKNIPGTYIIKNGLIKPVSDTVFKMYKFSTKNIVALTGDEVANAALGGYLPPPDGTYLKTPDGTYLYYKNGSTHSISPFVSNQRGINKLVLAFSAEEAALLDQGAPLPPKDGTLIKGDKSGAIYVIVKGQKKALDYNTWVKTYKKKAPSVLPQAEVDSYPNQGDEQ